MPKDAYYFTHDSNARDDPKCVLLIEQLGLEGYGIFWVLIETLRDQPDYKYPLALLPALARRYNTTHEKMKAVVSGYQLFQIADDQFFFSESLERRMKPLEHKREMARIAGLKSAEARALNAGSKHVQQTLNDRSTSKVNKSKEKERINTGGSGGETTSTPLPSPKNPGRKKYGQYGWVKLSDREYQSLSNDLGQEETERCISYIDESAQSNENKNRWRDWNLVVRRCHRNGWGLSGSAVKHEPPEQSKKQYITTIIDGEEVDMEVPSNE